MTTWREFAEALLLAAQSSEVTVDRSFVAPGRDFMLACSLLAVHPERTTIARRASDDDLGGHPTVVPVQTFVVTYQADCYPPPIEGNAGQPSLVDPDAVTAWTVEYIDNARAVWDAVTAAVQSCPTIGHEPLEEGDPGPAVPITGLCLHCLDAVVGEMEWNGPQGLKAWVRIPVRVACLT